MEVAFKYGIWEFLIHALIPATLSSLSAGVSRIQRDKNT